MLPTNARKTEVAELLGITENWKKYRDDNGKAYVRIERGGHYETHRVDSEEFKMILHEEFQGNNDFIAKDRNIKEAIEMITNDAKLNGRKIDLNVRVAKHKDSIYYDLTDKKWCSVKLNKKGWEIEDNTPLVFKRFNHQKRQCIPKRNGKLKELMEFINVHEDSKLLFAVTVVSYFIPEIQHPIMLIHGEKGSGKSSISKVLKNLIDPSVYDILRLPKKASELPQLLSKHWFAPFDNVSKLSEEFADDFCCAVTGACFPKRELYTVDNEFNYKIKNCNLLNCKTIITRRDDFLDRSVLIKLDRIDEKSRISDEQFWKDFDNAKPRILGGIFDLIVKAMNIYDNVNLDSLFRLTDYTKWCYAIAEAMGGERLAAKFIEEYRFNIERQNAEILDSDPVATALMVFIRKKGSWKGYMHQLLFSLEAFSVNEGINIKDELWPKSPSALSRRLGDLKSSLSDMKIDFQVQHKNLGAYIVIEKK